MVPKALSGAATAPDDVSRTMTCELHKWIDDSLRRYAPMRWE